jgi:tripartite-type tricarboxylate transporter receptor subunit TctC
MTLKTHWALLCVVLLASAPARGEDYPSRAITVVVSLAAGSGMDAITRLYAEKLSEAFGKPVIVENKPGAATTLAANQVARAPPDGYTLVVLTSIALSINPTLFKHLNYDPQDFTPIPLYVKSPFVLVIVPSLPAKTLSEFVERQEGKPAAELCLDRCGFGAAHVDGVCQEAARLRRNACAVSQHARVGHGSDGWPRCRELPRGWPLDTPD